jgi:hypothetical protein
MTLATPKRLGGGTVHKSQQRSKYQEKSTAKALGGRVTKASGSGIFEKADVRVKGIIRVESKTTIHRSFSVTQAIIDKIENQALAAGELPAMDIEILGGQRACYVLPRWALESLVTQVQELQAKLDALTGGDDAPE